MKTIVLKGLVTLITGLLLLWPPTLLLRLARRPLQLVVPHILWAYSQRQLQPLQAQPAALRAITKLVLVPGHS